MALLEVLKLPDPRLRRKAKEVAGVNADIVKLLDDMLETMYAAPGIGLAATQVNVLKRVIVLDLSEEQNQPIYLINPKILLAEGEFSSEEGCLSIPDAYEPVLRAEHLKVEGLDREGNLIEIDAHEREAVCLQHEIDHLDGKLFIDHISPLKRNRIQTRLQKQYKKDQRESK